MGKRVAITQANAVKAAMMLRHRYRRTLVKDLKLGEATLTIKDEQMPDRGNGWHRIEIDIDSEAFTLRHTRRQHVWDGRKRSPSYTMLTGHQAFADWLVVNFPDIAAQFHLSARQRIAA